MEQYLAVAFLLVVSLVVCGGVFLTGVLGPKIKYAPAVKLSPYECGVKPEGSARQPFKNRFYLIAVLFLLFDVDAVFFFPWALIYRQSLATGGALLIAGGVYLAFMALGLVYIFQKNCLEIT